MGLLEVHREAASGLAGSLAAFAQAFDLTSPGEEGVTATLAGQVTDIGQTIDPETQMPVAGRQISIVVSEAALGAAGLGRPRALQGSAPWMVRHLARNWRVMDVRSDRTLGLVTMFVEASE